jgi:hypothetical protein
VSKKKPQLKAPSQQSVQLLFDQVNAAPLQNMQHAAAVDKAMRELQAFFTQLYAGQIKDSASVNGIPQASASAGGN